MALENLHIWFFLVLTLELQKILQELQVSFEANWLTCLEHISQKFCKNCEEFEGHGNQNYSISAKLLSH